MVHRLSEDFFWDLKEGVLFPLLEWVRADQSLCLRFREDCVDIYYRGIRLLQVALTSGGYQASPPRYANTASGTPSMPDARLGSRADVRAWVDMAPVLKSKIDRERRKHPQNDHEPWQMFLRADETDGLGETKDYYLCDLDDGPAEASLGTVAVHRPAGTDIGRLVFILAGHGKAALAAGSTVRARIDHINRFLGDAERVQALEAELVGVFNQKRALGLLDSGGDLEGLSDQRPLLVLVLARGDGGPATLDVPRKDLPPSPRAKLRLAECAADSCGSPDSAPVDPENPDDPVADERHVVRTSDPPENSLPHPVLPGGRTPARGTRWRRALDLAANQLPTAVGLWLLVYGSFARSEWLVPPKYLYDEGVLLSNAHFLLNGLWPHRDFYAAYPPGIFLLLAALWRIFGVSAWTYRLLGIAIHVALLLLAGRLAGRIVGRRFSWLAAGMVSVWTIMLGLIPYAWLAGLVCGLAFIELWTGTRTGSSRARQLLAGVAYGLVGCFRHELFVYLTLAVGLCWLAPRSWRDWLGYARPDGSQLRWLLAGAAVPLCLVWLPTFVLAGWHAPIRDLLIEQVLHIQPARVLPMPFLTAAAHGTVLPRFLARAHEGSIVLDFSAPLLALGLLAARRWLRLFSPGAVVLLAVLALAALPQMLIRTDVWHTTYVVPPALVMACVLVEAVYRRLRRIPFKLVVTATLLWVLIRPAQADFWPRRPLLTTGMQESPSRRSSGRRGFLDPDELLASQRRPVLEYLERHTAKRERVVFALSSHACAMSNEVDLYFLANRLPGTRYTQYEPNLVTRLDVQEEMIDSLERHGVRVVVLGKHFSDCFERQPRLVPGSSRLDDYFRQRFTPVASHGVYTILERKRAPDPKAI